MKVSLIVKENQGTCTVEREDSDPKFRDSGWGNADSILLYHIKQALNAQGYDFIKKRMWKDGHLVDSDQLYLRERKSKNKRMLAIYSQYHAIRSAAQDFNEDGVVTLSVVNLM